MERLIRGRRPVRQQLSRLVNEVAELLKREEFTPEETKTLRVNYDLLASTFKSLEDWDEKVKEQLLLEAATEEAEDEEFKEMQRFKGLYLGARSDIDSFFSNQADDKLETESVKSSPSEKRRYHLPEVKIKSFNGTLKGWLGWWSQFRQIHEDDELHPTHKFQYLLQSMEAGTEAKDLVESYPMTAGNYPIAMEALRERYGRHDLQLQVYIRELLTLVISNVAGAQKLPLAQLYLRLESHLRSLAELNLDKADPATWLFPMVVSSLSTETLRAWQRSSYSKMEATVLTPKKTKLDWLMDFIKAEVRSEQQIALAQQGFREKKATEEKKGPKFSGTKSQRVEDIPTVASLFTSQAPRCSICDEDHAPEKCLTLRNMPYDKQCQLLREKNLCFKCFRPGHRRDGSRRRDVKCSNCQKGHYEIVCRKREKNSDPSQRRNMSVKRSLGNDSESGQKRVRFVKNGDINVVAQQNNQCSGNVLLNTVKVRVQVGEDLWKTVRLVGDGGSQRSFGVSSMMKQAIGVYTGDEWLQAIVFGAVKTVPRSFKKKKITLYGLNGGHMSLELLEKDTITGEIREIPTGPWTQECEKRGITLNDIGDRWSEADILVGNDYWGAIRTGRLVHLACGLTAEETVFGWTIGGPIDRVTSNNENIMAMTAALESVPPLQLEKLWSLETLGIRDPAESLTVQEEEQAALQHFAETVKRDADGRYIVSLPWKAPSATLPSNRRIAEQRLKATTSKLSFSGKLAQYHAVFQGWEKEGLISRVQNDCTAGHFIPHRPVFKESATTPVRPVFDASCRQGRNPSLNDCLYKGPNLIELILVMLLRFGENEIGVSADIRKAFQMLGVTLEDRKFQRFLWWEDEDCSNVVIYEHNRVVFGVTSSPFLLGATIQHHLDRCGVETALELKRCFYVDNLVTSVSTWQDCQKLKTDASKIMEDAKMELREWAFTHVAGVTEAVGENTMGILGITWDRKEDTLSCNVKKMSLAEKLTKRMMLSVVAQVFDPMGYVAPAMLLPKMMVQSLHLRKCGWDEPVPADVERKFRKWMKQLALLSEVKVKRWNKVENCVKSEVHIFCDSSSDGIAAVAFMKTTSGSETKLQFLMCKSRLSPPKGLTIPRAELVSCVIGVRIARTVGDALGLPSEAFNFWSDSSTALAWIRRAGDWGVFVRNRVNEILRTSKAEQWRHVPGAQNPADLPSRGCSPKALVESAWWEGPSWLKEDSVPFTSFPEVVDEEEINSEMKKTVTVMMMSTTQESPRFSSYRRNVAVWGWVLRLIRNCGWFEFGTPVKQPYLTVEEMRAAEKVVLWRIQRDSFPDGCKEIGGIHVLRDEDGIIRVRTRLARRDDTEDFIYPIVLPKVHPLVDLLVEEVHRFHGHGGVQFLLGKIREKYWIIQSRRVIRKVVRKCVKCRRHSAQLLEVDPAPLPKKRVEDCEVFSTTGVDLAGPLYLKNGEKVWIVLFTCAVYRAVHLDLVRSLVLALERFVAHYGRPNTIYSDCGTNFVGAANLFARVDWDTVETESDIRQIQWIFNPPTAAWWGGWWERIVRMVKDLLKRMLGKSRLSFDELRTCLVGICATINDRPLTMVTEDPMDMVPLTPAMFLRQRGLSHFGELEHAEGFKASYRTMKALQKAIQERFRKEYLGLLVTRGGKRRTAGIALGDVVLVGSDNRKRYEWPLGVVTELLPGNDGKTRLVRVKTASGMALRPLQRVFPLEIPEKANEISGPVISSLSKQEVHKTRSGREVKQPTRYGQWLHLVEHV